MNFDATISVRGRYKILRRKAIEINGVRTAGPVIDSTPWSKNILTLYYFNQGFQGQVQPLGCVVGTGNSTPDETDTVLDAYLAHTIDHINTTTTNNWTVSPRYAQMTRTFRFGEGVAAGNVAEVGIVMTTSSIDGSTPIISRALPVDNMGNPTSITVLSDEYLDVVWECTWYVPEDVAGTFTMTIDGVPTNFNYTVRATSLGEQSHWNFTSSRASLGGYRPLFSATSGSFAPASYSFANTSSTLVAYETNTNGVASNRVTDVVAESYINDSKEREYKFVFALDVANIAVQSFFIALGGSLTSVSTGLGKFQVLLDAPITKDASKILTFSFKLSMANAP